MSNYAAIKEILNRISGQQNVFTVPKIYVDYTGDVTTAILLNQIVFLSDKTKRKDGYFYKTYKEWTEEICLTERQVRYSVKKLKKMEILETKVQRANGSPTVHYKLLFDKFIDSILTFCQYPSDTFVSMDSNLLSGTLTEITTEKEEEEEGAISFYEKNFGMISPFIAEDILHWTNDLSNAVVIEAMKAALSNGTRTWNYVTSILRDWASKNVATVADVEALRAEFKNKQNKKYKKKGIDWGGFDLDD